MLKNQVRGLIVKWLCKRGAGYFKNVYQGKIWIVSLYPHACWHIWMA